MDLFRKVMSYIIKTATISITTSPIWNALPHQSTGRFTETANTWMVTGTKRCIPMCASSVGQSIRLSERLRRSIAEKPVRKSICETTSSTMRSGCALSVNQSTLLTNIENHKPVREYVEHVYVRAVRRATGKRAVYNLSVAETPEYFAQGVLVHNCIADALAWHASLVFGDQHKGHVLRNKPNVMNATEDNVPRESFAWRRAQYLKMLGKKKLETTW